MEERLLEEQRRTNQLLEKLIKQSKDPNELLTIEQVKEETNFGLGTVQKMFKDPRFKAQRYTVPFVVTRKALYEYISEGHDYLSRR